MSNHHDRNMSDCPIQANGRQPRIADLTKPQAILCELCTSYKSTKQDVIQQSRNLGGHSRR